MRKLPSGRPSIVAHPRTGFDQTNCRWVTVIGGPWEFDARPFVPLFVVVYNASYERRPKTALDALLVANAVFRDRMCGVLLCCGPRARRDALELSAPGRSLSHLLGLPTDRPRLMAVSDKTRFQLTAQVYS